MAHRSLLQDFNIGSCDLIPIRKHSCNQFHETLSETDQRHGGSTDEGDSNNAGIWTPKSPAANVGVAHKNPNSHVETATYSAQSPATQTWTGRPTSAAVSISGNYHTLISSPKTQEDICMHI